MRRLAMVTILFAATVLCAQDTTKEMEKLNGVWVVASAESGGTKIPNDSVKDFKLTIKDGAFTALVGGVESKGTLKIDPTRKPMTMDIALDAPADKGKTQLAVYDLQSGVLKICAAEIEKKDRPADFETKDKPGVTLLIFKKGQ